MLWGLNERDRGPIGPVVLEISGVPKSGLSPHHPIVIGLALTGMGTGPNGPEWAADVSDGCRAPSCHAAREVVALVPSALQRTTLSQVKSCQAWLCPLR